MVMWPANKLSLLCPMEAPSVSPMALEEMFEEKPWILVVKNPLCLLSIHVHTDFDITDFNSFWEINSKLNHN